MSTVFALDELGVFACMGGLVHCAYGPRASTLYTRVEGVRQGAWPQILARARPPLLICFRRL